VRRPFRFGIIWDAERDGAVTSRGEGENRENAWKRRWQLSSSVMQNIEFERWTISKRLSIAFLSSVSA
jgi:hypothetical protein